VDDCAQTLMLNCVRVSKSYSIQEGISMWRMLLGGEIGGQMVHALRGISMGVPRGKIVGILGRNGAGKSTLLRVLGGVYPPTSGRVEVYGQIAGLFELGGMGNSNLTGREYATRYLRMMGTPTRRLSRLLEDIWGFSELEGAFEERILTYSSGMAARLYFATATALEAEIYLIDELLSVGDEHFQVKCWNRMRQRLLNGASGVLVTHDWTAILKLCEQTHVLDRGAFAFSGPSDKAVVSYLNIAKPESSVARFSSANPQSHIVQSGQDAQLRFLVEIDTPEEVDFSMSVEALRIGIGWEVVLLSNGTPVAEHQGRYVVIVTFPKCPLVPGRYSLNVALWKRKLPSQRTTVVLDNRSWTLGNGFELLVEGPSVATAAKLPYTVSKSADEV